VTDIDQRLAMIKRFHGCNQQWADGAAIRQQVFEIRRSECLLQRNAFAVAA
jgi:hypothetical protein